MQKYNIIKDLTVPDKVYLQILNSNWWTLDHCGISSYLKIPSLNVLKELSNILYSQENSLLPTACI